MGEHTQSIGHSDICDLERKAKSKNFLFAQISFGIWVPAADRARRKSFFRFCVGIRKQLSTSETQMMDAEKINLFAFNEWLLCKQTNKWMNDLFFIYCAEHEIDTVEEHPVCLLLFNAIER